MLSTERRRPSVFTWNEGRTGSGQVISFMIPSGENPEDVKSALAKAWDLEIPISHPITNHGCFGCYSRYGITQHKYAGYEEGVGYDELLEISDPPDGRWGIVINSYRAYTGKGWFSEWKTLEDALSTWQNAWSKMCEPQKEELAKMHGFRRFVECGQLTPWFYAVGDQELIGDRVFPEGLHDDPVFSFGRKFVLTKENGETIKTCLGCRFLHDLTPEYNRDDRKRKDVVYRFVYWDDGTTSKITDDEKLPVRPLTEKEFWIEEAMAKFRRLLAGGQTEFSIQFSDGQAFIGKIRPKNNRLGWTPAGDYFLVVSFAEGEPTKGWVNDWKPTPENPNLIESARQKLEIKEKRQVLKIEIKKKRIQKDTKKMARSFLRSTEVQ